MSNLHKYLGKILLLIILITAAFLRLYRIGEYMTFLGDEGRDVLVVYNILHGNLTLLGPTASVGGFFLGPIYYYFMAPFLWLFNYDPVGPAVMVGLCGVITVWLVYKMGEKFFDCPTGIFAASLYAVSPVVIAYSRSSWNPNLMPLFSILTMWSLYKAVTQKKQLYFILSGILYGVAMQLHYIELFLGVIIFLFLTIQRYKEYRNKIYDFLLRVVKDLSSFAVGFAIGISPFFAFEFRHGFPNTITIVKFIFNSPDTGGNSKFFSITANVFFRLFARLVTKFPPPEQYSLNVHPDIAFMYYFTIALGISSIAIFIYQYKRSKYKDSFTLLFLWFFVGIFLFGFYKRSIYDYYFQFMFPLPFLFVGNLLSSILQKEKFSWISIGLFLILLFVNLTGAPIRFTPNRQKDQVKQIADFVLSKTDNRPYNFALITGGNSDHAYRYFFKLKGRDPITIENQQIDPSRRSVTHQLLIVCEYPNCQPLGNSLWEVAGFGRAEIVGRWSVSVVQVYKLAHYKGK